MMAFILLGMMVGVGTVMWLETKSITKSRLESFAYWVFCVIVCLPASAWVIIQEFYRNYIKKEKN